MYKNTFDLFDDNLMASWWYQ